MISQAVVPKDRRLYSGTFRTERRVTKGNPVSPTVFSIVVDTVVRAVLLEVYDP